MEEERTFVQNIKIIFKYGGEITLTWIVSKIAIFSRFIVRKTAIIRGIIVSAWKSNF